VLDFLRNGSLQTLVNWWLLYSHCTMGELIKVSAAVELWNRPCLMRDIVFLFFMEAFLHVGDNVLLSTIVLHTHTHFHFDVSVSTVTVQTPYSSPWTLLSYLVISQGVTDLLASHDLFLAFGQKTIASCYIQFEWPELGRCHHRRQVTNFLKTWILSFDMSGVIICLRKGITEPWTKEYNCF
jgi:hypothetical protein